MEGIQTLKGSWPWPWPSIRPYGISSCSSHRPLPIYQLSFKLKKLFVDRRTYGRTDGRTDIFPLYTIRSTFGSRPKNVSLSQCYSHTVLDVWMHATASKRQSIVHLCLLARPGLPHQSIVPLCLLARPGLPHQNEIHIDICMLPSFTYTAKAQSTKST